ncbi:MAG: fibronectin type III domain-containing protein, partial [Patulibacter sp.]|nr:fibronectin type III domain-containing protein [Patulibacter sp.]
IDTVPPAQVTGVSVTMGLDYTNLPVADVRWTATTDNVGVVGYDVYAQGSGGNVLVASVGGSETRAFNIHTNGYPTTAFTVVAKDFIGNASTPSDPVTANTCGLVPPTVYPPTGVVADTVTATAATISWRPSSATECSAAPPTGYAVIDRASGTGVQLVTTSPTTYSVRVALSPDTRHVISVVPTGGGQRLLESSSIEVQTPPVTCPATPRFVRGPSGASVSDVTTTTATITWPNEPPSECGQVIPTAFEVATADHVVLATVASPGTSATLTGLTPGTIYNVHVHAIGGEYSGPGDSGPFNTNSPDVTFTTVAPVDPPTDTATFGVAGTATLKNLTKGALPLSGQTTATFAADGAVSANLTIAPIRSVTLKVLGFLPVSATVEMIPTAPVTGQLTGTRLTATAKVRIKLPKITTAGIPLAGGAGCQATQVSSIPLASTGPFTVAGGGTLAGSFSISNLAGCGVLTGLVSPLTAGGGNAIAVTLTPAAPSAT